MTPSASIVRFLGCDLDISPIPLRKVIKRGGLRANVKFCSRKMPKQKLPTESSNEHAFLMRAELDPTVTHIYAQAIQIQWRDSSGPRSHYPDFIIVRDGRVEVHEVKPDSEAATDEVKSTAAFAKQYFHSRGAAYGLALESVLKAKPTFGHAEDALYRLHNWIDERLERTVVAFVQDNDSITIDELVRALGSKGCTPATALTLIAQNRLHVDYRYPLDGLAKLHSQRGCWNEGPRLLLKRAGEVI